jgi:hypothetical protein
MAFFAKNYTNFHELIRANLCNLWFILKTLYLSVADPSLKRRIERS